MSVATSGAYSDYGIDGVYSTREKAEAAMRRDGVPDSRIEQYVVDDAEGVRGPWSVRMRKTGDWAEAGRVTDPNSINVIYRGRDDMHITVMADTEQQAVKVANERRSLLIASGIWVDGTEPIQLTPEMFEGAHGA